MQYKIARLVGHFGWWLTAMAIAIPLIAWLQIDPLQERIASPYQALTSIGRISGIIGIVLFCLNMILSTRLKLFEWLFGGLNKVYIAHHLSGGLALCIVLVHPISLSIRLADQSIRESALLLLPRWSDIPLALGVIGLWVFIILMLLTFYFSLPYKIWLFTHKFLGLAFLLIALHVLLMPNDLDQSVLLKRYVFVLLGLAAISFIYRTLLPRFLVRRYKYTVAHVTPMSSGVVKIAMEPKGRGIDFKSGQFIFVSFRTEGFSSEWHPFTISSNAKDERLSITVKSLGQYTGTLVRFAPGMIGMDVLVEGAYGRFNFRNFKAKKQIWIAGGIGITPFLSMVNDIPADYKVDLYYSVKSESEVLEWPTLVELAGKSGGSMRLIPIVTDKVGFLTGNKIKEISGPLKDSEFLLCGPPPMMNALKSQLKDLGVSRWAMHSEEFSMS